MELINFPIISINKMRILAILLVLVALATVRLIKVESPGFEGN